MNRTATGFTLIELLVSLAIVGTLASIAWPMAELEYKRAKERELVHALAQIRQAIDRYKAAADAGRIAKTATESGYPPTLLALVDGVEDIQSPSRDKMYFLRRIPRDPWHADSATATQNTWGLRSYASPPDDPQPGLDVFDVYSLSSGVGINGIPYRQW